MKGFEKTDLHILTEFFNQVNIHLPIDFDFSYILVGLGTTMFFLTTLFTGSTSFTSIRPVSKDFNELQRLKAVLETKSMQLEEAKAIIEKQSFLLKKYGVTNNTENRHAEKLEKLFNSVLLTEHSWAEFKKTFDSVHYGFLTSLKMRYSDLTEGEKRLSVLIKLKISTKDMARMLGISPNSIIKSRYRLKKKICKSEPDKSLEEVILEI